MNEKLLGVKTQSPINLTISTTTGGNFDIEIENDSKTIEHLKKLVSKKLKVPKDRWVLIFNERELQEGTIRENGLVDGSKIILTPNVETGLLAQRAENTVMQALESLNDAQVNDFLSGKSPLNLSVRLGDHMMLIQLQLSTLNPTASTSAALPSAVGGGAKLKSLPRSKTISTNTASVSRTQSFYGESAFAKSGETSNFRRYHSDDLEAGTSGQSPKITEIVNTLKATPTINNYDSIEVPTTFVVEDDESKQSEANFSDLDTMDTDSLLDQSPIKSLSNLVSGPIKTTPIIRNNNVVPVPRSSFATSSPLVFEPSANSSMCSDPISANLTSCLCKRLDNSGAGISSSSSSCDIDSCQQATTSSGYLTAPSSPVSLLHRTINSSIAKSKHRPPNQQMAKAFFRKAMSAECVAAGTSSPHSPLSLPTTPNRIATPPPIPSTAVDTPSPTNTIDNTALAEASRNLTQTLRKLSKRCFPNKIDITEDNSRKLSSTTSQAGKTAAVAGSSGGSGASGAVIESMKHHGKGIYSGTFSGTLNPALQDKYGRPKRDISTIIHILNDLLSAAPQCARSGAKIIFEPATPSHSVQSTSSGTPHSSSGKYMPKMTSLSASSTPHRYPSPMSKTACTSCTKICTYGECNGHYSSPSGSTSIRKPNIFTNIDNYSQTTTPHTSSAVRRLNESFDRADFYASSTSMTASTSTANPSYPHCKCLLQPTSPISPGGGNPIMNAFEMENNKTKCKVDQLRLVMQQKKERREARKLKIAPYSAGARVAACGVGDLLPNLGLATASTPSTANKSTSTTGDNTANSNSSTSTTISSISTTTPSEPSPNCMVEEVDTVA